MVIVDDSEELAAQPTAKEQCQPAFRLLDKGKRPHFYQKILKLCTALTYTRTGNKEFEIICSEDYD